MARTRKIKVNSVQVGDPNLTVQFQVEDTGVFSTFVQVLATVTFPNSTTPTQVSGVAQSNVSPNSSTLVTVQCPFSDSNYASGQTFAYNITSVQFSDTSNTGPWTTYAGPQDGVSWNSSVQSSDFPQAVAREVVGAPAPTSFWGKIIAFFRRLFS